MPRISSLWVVALTALVAGAVTPPDLAPLAGGPEHPTEEGVAVPGFPDAMVGNPTAAEADLLDPFGALLTPSVSQLSRAEIQAKGRKAYDWLLENNPTFPPVLKYLDPDPEDRGHKEQDPSRYLDSLSPPLPLCPRLGSPAPLSLYARA